MNWKLLNSILVVTSNVARGLLWMLILRFTGTDLYGDITTFNTVIAYTSIFIGFEVFRVINKPLLDKEIPSSLFFFERLIVSLLIAVIITFVFLKLFIRTEDYVILFVLLLGCIILENINLELGRIFNFKELYLPTTIGNSLLVLLIPVLVLYYHVKSISVFLVIVLSIALLRMFWFILSILYHRISYLFTFSHIDFKGLIGIYLRVTPFLIIAFFEACLPIFDRIMLKRYTDILGLFNLFSMMFVLAPLIFESYFVYPKFTSLKKRFVENRDLSVLSLPFVVLVLLFFCFIAGFVLDDFIFKLTGEYFRSNIRIIIYILIIILIGALRGFAYLLFYFADRQMEYLRIYIGVEIFYIFFIIASTYMPFSFESMFFITQILVHSILVLILNYKLSFTNETKSINSRTRL